MNGPCGGRYASPVKDTSHRLQAPPRSLFAAMRPLLLGLGYPLLVLLILLVVLGAATASFPAPVLWIPAALFVGYVFWRDRKDKQTFEPWAVTSGVFCLLAVMDARNVAMALASSGEHPSWPDSLRAVYASMIYFAASFTSGAVSLVRIWLGGHTRAGALIATYGLILSPCWAWVVLHCLVGPTAGPRTPSMGPLIDLTAPAILVFALVTGALVYLGCLLTWRIWGERHRRGFAGIALAVVALWMAGMSWQTHRFIATDLRIAYSPFSRTPLSSTCTPDSSLYREGGYVVRVSADGSRFHSFAFHSDWVCRWTDLATLESSLVKSASTYSPDTERSPLADSLLLNAESEAPFHHLQGVIEILRHDELSRLRLLLAVHARNPQFHWPHFLAGYDPSEELPGALPVEIRGAGDAGSILEVIGGDGFRFEGVRHEEDSDLTTAAREGMNGGLRRVVLRVDPDATYGEVVRAIDAVRTAGDLVVVLAPGGTGD